MKYPCLLMFLLLLCAGGVGWSGTLTCAGVLGNSGEGGPSLVRFSAPTTAGIGVACDRFGALWDRGGDGTLNRYAVDGRLLAQYVLPRGNSGWMANNQLALVGDQLIICAQGQLYRLAITAPPGAAAMALNVKADRISWNAAHGAIAIARGRELALVQVATGAVAPVATFTGDLQWLEMGTDGAIYPIIDWQVRKYLNGVEIKDGWPKSVPGERPQLLDGYWYGHTWHGTLKRFTSDLQPAPGVVLGGASGSFIGHLDQYAEIQNGRGLAHVRDNLFAISGMGGVLHLLAWQADKQQMAVVRRIGSVADCSGLGLDRQGNIWWACGGWQWADTPDAPMRNGVNNPDEIGQSVMLANDSQVAAGWLWGKPTFYRGSLAGEVNTDRIENGCALARGMVAATAYADTQGKLVLLTLSKAGKGQAFYIGNDGRYLGEAGPVTLQTTTPVQAWTTLAMQGTDTLLGAGDGAIVEFAHAGANWTETKRWRQTAEGDAFGHTIYCSADSGRLWIADRERNRVLVIDLADGKTLAVFGKRDLAGNDLTTLSTPEMLIARGDRAVVFDQGNQRLLKLLLIE